MARLRIPNRREIEQRSQNCDFFALNTSINFDHETAVSLADRFCHHRNFFFLESATAGPGSIARYSFVGFDALVELNSDGPTTKFRNADDALESVVDLNPLAALERYMKGLSIAQMDEGETYFRELELNKLLGWFGYFSYELMHEIEPSVPLAAARAIDMPVSHLFLPRNFLVIDHLRNRLCVCHIIDLRSGDRSEKISAGLDSLEDLLQSLEAVHQLPELDFTQEAGQIVEQSFDETRFTDAVNAAKAQIVAGEIFQIQIGNRIRVKTDARPMDIFRHLRILNPSPYMFFYKFGEHQLLGASPEMMVQVEGQRMVHRPIAGTRKRTWDGNKDRKMVEELMSSEKERAEHIMLVDLSRNDIGRVAAPGSVRLEDLMSVETYSHVFHLVSQVSGELRNDKTAFDAMISSFPNGTVCGAPKIRAMQLIAHYEKLQRQFYAGSLGVFSFNGDLKSTILIRTIHMAHGIASTQASAGVVYDSTAEQEWLEVRNKLAACLTAMTRTRKFTEA